MPEYITKAQALSAMRKATNCTWDDIWNTEYELKSVPAADVAPVVHARWEFYGEDGHGFGLWKCTRCGNVTGEKYAEAYCPHCGARML